MLLLPSNLRIFAKGRALVVVSVFAMDYDRHPIPIETHELFDLVGNLGALGKP
jgi:hypothetical protein